VSGAKPQPSWAPIERTGPQAARPLHEAPPRSASVLLLVYPKDGQPHLVFTKRTETVGAHRGQISLPGGSRENEDATPAHTALREAREEIGISVEDVVVHGRLEDVYVVVSNFLVTPVVGSLDYAPSFTANPDEVAEIIEVPLTCLRDPETLREEEWERSGVLRRVQVYQCGPHAIWGATARVLQLFLDSPYASD